MLKVAFKIMPKKRGNWFPQLIVSREYIESDELKLNPLFNFKKEYQLPGKIFFATKNELKVSDVFCKSIDKITININTYFSTPCAMHIRACLSCSVCGYTCQQCHAFLEWRPGAKPDYSDFIAVFEQVAQDIIEAWQKAVQEAYNSGENDEVDIVFSSDSYKQVRVEEELKTKPTRKLRLADGGSKC